jgi:hypothetical protein
MLKRLFTERIEFRLEMPIIGWLVLIGYIVVDLLFVLVKVGKMVLGFD